jgi:hypothetical protein
MSYRAIAEEIGCGTGHISRRLKLLSLAPEVQHAVDNGDLGPAAAHDLAELADAEQQVAAWRLVRDEGIHVIEARNRVLAGLTVPAGNTGATDEADRETGDAAPAAVPAGNAASADRNVPRGNTAVPEQKANAAARSIPDRFAADRTAAAADREAACKALLERHELLPVDALSLVLASAMLTPMQQSAAQARAHAWLRASGRQGLDVSSASAYFEAVLSAGDPDLVLLAGFATALAAAEIRASDRRRPWDARDAAHVRLLMDHVGYVPETEWEKGQLGLGVPRENVPL